MTASSIVLTISVGILPCYGITMMIIDRVSKKLLFLEPWVVDRAAVVYLVFLAIGNVAHPNAGWVLKPPVSSRQRAM